MGYGGSQGWIDIGKPRFSEDLGSACVFQKWVLMIWFALTTGYNVLDISIGRSELYLFYSIHSKTVSQVLDFGSIYVDVVGMEGCCVKASQKRCIFEMTG